MKTLNLLVLTLVLVMVASCGSDKKNTVSSSTTGTSAAYSDPFGGQSTGTVSDQAQQALSQFSCSTGWVVAQGQAPAYGYYIPQGAVSSGTASGTSTKLFVGANCYASGKCDVLLVGLTDSNTYNVSAYYCPYSSNYTYSISQFTNNYISLSNGNALGTMYFNVCISTGQCQTITSTFTSATAYGYSSVLY